MKMSFARAGVITLGGLVIAGTVLVADGTRFSDFTPLTSSAGPTLNEAAPITFGNSLFQQESIADRTFQLASFKPNSGSWDMNTLNETGHHKGRFLFTVFETGTSGVQRHDLKTGVSDTIWQSRPDVPAGSFDPSFWTPWGTFVTGEENWGCSGPAYRCGRLFEFRNPTTAPGIFTPLGPTSNDGADFVHQNVIPRASQEGMQFDDDGNLYFIDELNGGNIYRYTPKARFSKVLEGKADYFAAGRTAVLRVGDGNTFGAVGPYTWVPMTDAEGHALPGAVTITDSNGLTSVDARNTTNLPAFKGTDYNRPEDMQIQTIHGRQYLYVPTTDTHQVFRLDLQQNAISLFVDRTTTDLATGLAVGTAFANPDNLAVDHDGNIYIVEDRSGAVDDDIWFAKDLNKDGDLLDAGEGIGRWASNGTPGSEFTGLYFDPFNKRRAWVDIQHPASGNDRTIEITIPHGHDDGDDDDHGHDHDDDHDHGQ